MADEQWRQVVGWESTHEVSNLGRVRRSASAPKTKGYFPGHIHSPSNGTTGYPQVVLTKDGKSKTRRIHRLVAEAWIPNPERKRTVNHIDGDKLNSRVENLEWATFSENTRHAITYGLLVCPVGSRCGNAKFDEETARAIIVAPDERGLVRRLARLHGVSPSTISRMRSGKQWAHVTASAQER